MLEGRERCLIDIKQRIALNSKFRLLRPFFFLTHSVSWYDSMQKRSKKPVVGLDLTFLSAMSFKSCIMSSDIPGGGAGGVSGLLQ